MEQIRYMCYLCSKHYADKYRLKDHIKRTHIGLIKILDCYMCPKAFETECGLKEHISIIHEGVLFLCETCPKSFKSKKNLKGHIEKVHQGKRKYIICEECQRKYGSRSALRIHMKNDHLGKPVDTKIFKCSNCGFWDLLFSNFKQHQKIKCNKLKPHSNGIVCDYCPRIFKSKSRVATHIESFHIGNFVLFQMFD